MKVDNDLNQIVEAIPDDQSAAEPESRPSPSWFHRLIRKPLVHFLLIGALLFGLHTYIHATNVANRSDVITVSPQLIAQLSKTWERQWKRPPNSQELQHLIESNIQEEVLYREALAMNLDQNDTIPDRAPQLGDRFMLNYDYVAQEPLDIRQYFGKSFTDELFTLAPQRWQGPVKSGYGLHLIRISDRRSEQPAELSQVYEDVKRTLMDERRLEANDAFYQALLSKYTLNVDDAILTEYPEMKVSLDSGFNRQAGSLNRGAGFNISGY